jgi:hypothetical protein
MSNPENQYLIDKPRFLAPVKEPSDVFYNERTDTVYLNIRGQSLTLTGTQAWDLLSTLERELHGQDYDRKDD